MLKVFIINIPICTKLNFINSNIVNSFQILNDISKFYFDYYKFKKKEY